MGINSKKKTMMVYIYKSNTLTIAAKKNFKIFTNRERETETIYILKIAL